MTMIHLLSIVVFIVMGAVGLSTLQSALAPLKKHVSKQINFAKLPKFTLFKKSASTDHLYSKANLA